MCAACRPLRWRQPHAINCVAGAGTKLVARLRAVSSAANRWSPLLYNYEQNGSLSFQPALRPAPWRNPHRRLVNIDSTLEYPAVQEDQRSIEQGVLQALSTEANTDEIPRADRNWYDCASRLAAVAAN